jgi:hypothetical protein
MADKTSLANPDVARTTHIDIDWTVDFGEAQSGRPPCRDVEVPSPRVDAGTLATALSAAADSDVAACDAARVLHVVTCVVAVAVVCACAAAARAVRGSCTYTVVAEADGASEVVFDCSTPLMDAGVSLGEVLVNGAAATARRGATRGALGTALHVDVPAALQGKGSTFTVTIPYSLSETCSAMQFLSPSQVAAARVCGVRPFVVVNVACDLSSSSTCALWPWLSWRRRRRARCTRTCSRSARPSMRERCCRARTRTSRHSVRLFACRRASPLPLPTLVHARVSLRRATPSHVHRTCV